MWTMGLSYLTAHNYEAAAMWSERAIQRHPVETPGVMLKMVLGALPYALPLGLALAGISLPALASDKRDNIKSVQQVFETNCLICHDRAQLTLTMEPRRLSKFLMVHYTTSARTAEMLARYLTGDYDARREPAQMGTAE